MDFVNKLAKYWYDTENQREITDLQCHILALQNKIQCNFTFFFNSTYEIQIWLLINKKKN